MFLDYIERLLDPAMLGEWIELISKTLTIIPSCMGILVVIAIINFVIRAFF